MFSGGSIWTMGLPAATHSPSRYKRVEDEAVAWGGDRFLVQLPRRLRQRCLVSRDLTGLRLELLVAARQRCDDQVALILAHQGGVGVDSGARGDQLGHGNAAGGILRFVALQQIDRFLVLDLGCGELGRNDVLLRRTLAGAQVSQASFVGPQELARLGFGRGFRFLIECEQRMAGVDGVAACY